VGSKYGGTLSALRRRTGGSWLIWDVGRLAGWVVAWARLGPVVAAPGGGAGSVSALALGSAGQAFRPKGVRQYH